MLIAALDLMPLFWILGIVLSVSMFFSGEHASLFSVLPAALAALSLHVLRYPPRRQVLVFLAVSAVLFLLYVLFRRLLRRRKKQKNLQKPLDSGANRCYNDTIN